MAPTLPSTATCTEESFFGRRLVARRTTLAALIFAVLRLAAVGYRAEGHSAVVRDLERRAGDGMRVHLGDRLRQSQGWGEGDRQVGFTATPGREDAVLTKTSRVVGKEDSGAIL